MIIAGCLSLVVLPLAGLTIGALFGGAGAATVGAIAGLAIALGLTGVSVYALVKASRRG